MERLNHDATNHWLCQHFGLEKEGYFCLANYVRMIA